MALFFKGSAPVIKRAYPQISNKLSITTLKEIISIETALELAFQKPQSTRKQKSPSGHKSSSLLIVGFFIDNLPDNLQNCSILPSQGCWRPLEWTWTLVKKLRFISTTRNLSACPAEGQQHICVFRVREGQQCEKTTRRTHMGSRTKRHLAILVPGLVPARPLPPLNST